MSLSRTYENERYVDFMLYNMKPNEIKNRKITNRIHPLNRENMKTYLQMMSKPFENKASNSTPSS